MKFKPFHNVWKSLLKSLILQLRNKYIWILAPKISITNSAYLARKFKVLKNLLNEHKKSKIIFDNHNLKIDANEKIFLLIFIHSVSRDNEKDCGNL